MAAGARTELEGSLCVVGTGIRAVSHLTLEARARIERAGLLLYSVSDSVTEQWLREANPRCESLRPYYRIGSSRRSIYDAMVHHVVERVRGGADVCLALYGHPGLCARVGHESIRVSRAEGYEARMLPGISCEDCLFADLGFDPADAGCQSYEASVFLERRIAFDARAALVLWQVGMLGCFDYRLQYEPAELDSLIAHLASGYGSGHEAILYEAPAYAQAAPIVRSMPVANLGRAEFTWATTLFVPPLER